MQTHTGLTQKRAAELLNSLGPNELPSSGRQSVFKILLRVLQEPMLLLLVACGLIYIFTGEKKDGLLLFASAVIVVSITLYQEVKSERALEALRDLTSPRALVIRDGIMCRIPGREVVPGDLIRVSEGDRVPADSTLISTTHLAVDESLLTGESFPITKFADPHPSALLQSGTLVISGQGLAIVTATGSKTEIGKIGRSLETATDIATPLQRELGRLVRIFGSLGAFFSLAIAIVYGLTRHDWPKGILAGLAAAMSLLPEEFPVVMTVFFAMGAWRISKKQVLTRRVAAVEALGSISALCVDKTGTLTQNRMSVREVVPDSDKILEIASLACHENPFDPMEKAILEAHQLRGGESNSKLSSKSRTRQGLYPLSSGMMAMSCVWKLGDSRELCVASKGSPEAIIQLCHLDKAASQKILNDVHDLAEKGLRVLAVAGATWNDAPLPQSQHDFDFHFYGLLALEDPIRSDVPSAIKECEGAGIRVLMLTGDYPETAKSIARQLGLPTNVVSGSEIARLDDLKLRQIVQQTSVFARVTPEQKLRIVTALRANNETVAMTGDGVNDAPSLKWADIGVAMGGRGTDVARESAAIVLLDDSFTSMISAIRLGRRIYDNLKKAIFYILAVHVSIAGLAMIPVILGIPLLLLPAHIVFLELIIDPACSLVYEAELEEPDLMKRKPRNPNASLMQWKDLIQTISQGTLVLVMVLSYYLFLLKTATPPNQARAGAFVTLILGNLGLILVSRAQKGGLLRTVLKPNAAFIAIMLGTIAFLALTLTLDPIRHLFSFDALTLTQLAAAVGTGLFSLILCNAIRFLNFGQASNPNPR